MTQKVPNALKLLNGNPGHRPILPEPKIKALPAYEPAPPEICAEAQSLWSQMLPLLPEGLLTIADKQLFIRYLELVVLYRELQVNLQENGRSEKRYNAHGHLKGEFLRPQCNEALRVAKELRAIESQLGFSPVSRSKVSVTESLQDAHDIARLLMVYPTLTISEAIIADREADLDFFGD